MPEGVFINGPLIILNREGIDAATKDGLLKLVNRIINDIQEIERTLTMANPALEGLTADLTKLKSSIGDLKVGGTALPPGALAADEVLQVKQQIGDIQKDVDAKAGGAANPG